MDSDTNETSLLQGPRGFPGKMVRELYLLPISLQTLRFSLHRSKTAPLSLDRQERKDHQGHQDPLEFQASFPAPLCDFW